jgi:hypothetical protein
MVVVFTQRWSHLMPVAENEENMGARGRERSDPTVHLACNAAMALEPLGQETQYFVKSRSYILPLY